MRRISKIYIHYGNEVKTDVLDQKIQNKLFFINKVFDRVLDLKNGKFEISLSKNMIVAINFNKSVEIEDNEFQHDYTNDHIYLYSNLCGTKNYFFDNIEKIITEIVQKLDKYCVSNSHIRLISAFRAVFAKTKFYIQESIHVTVHDQAIVFNEIIELCTLNNFYYIAQNLVNEKYFILIKTDYTSVMSSNKEIYKLHCTIKINPFTEQNTEILEKREIECQNYLWGISFNSFYIREHKILEFIYRRKSFRLKLTEIEYFSTIDELVDKL